MKIIRLKTLIFVVSLGAVLGINLYLRAFPITFPQLKQTAREIVEQSIRQSIAAQVQQQFPQFYPTAKDAILKSQLFEYKKQNKKIIKEQTHNLYLKLKDGYQDEKGQTYLMELDCWHWARYVENVVRLGHPGDEVVHGRQWDLYMQAPIGFYLHWEEFLFYLCAYLYKFFSIFKQIPLFTFLFYIPLFFSAIFIFVLFMFSYRYGRLIGAITSCLVVGLAPMFLARSCAGWFDTDVLNLLFPLLVVWTHSLSVSSPNLKHRLFWLIFSAFGVGLFCYSWTHWWFIFFIVIISEILYLAYRLIFGFLGKKMDLEAIKLHGLSLILFIFFSLFWILLIAGKEPLGIVCNHLKLAMSLSKPLMLSIWPNVYSTVGELRRMTFSDMARSIGSVWLSMVSLLCLAILVVRALFWKKYTDFERFPIIILTVWFIVMVFACLNGVRFVVFLLPPLGIALGWVLNDIHAYFNHTKNKKAIFVVVISFIGLSMISVWRGYAAAKTIFPLIDDTWYSVLTTIKEKTSQDTIINSWWDFGDWFKVVAGRRVIFDGQSQDLPQAYWMAKALLSNDEDNAVGILRMLNNGGNRAFDLINEYVKEPLESVLLLESIMYASPDTTQERLLKFMPQDKAGEVIRILFSQPARAVFVVDSSMVYKTPAFSYLGNWNFPKVYVAQKFDKEEKGRIIDHLKNLSIDENSVQQYYQEVFLVANKNLDEWLSQRLQFYGGPVSGREENGSVFFGNGFVYNPKEQSIKINSGQIPRSLFVMVNNDLVEIAHPNANVPFSILVFQDMHNAYKSVLLDRELAGSLFSRLYFFNGRGLKHFVPFIDAETPPDNYLRVCHIVW